MDGSRGVRVRREILLDCSNRASLEAFHHSPRYTIRIQLTTQIPTSLSLLNSLPESSIQPLGRRLLS